MVTTAIVFLILDALGYLHPSLCWNRAEKTRFFDGVVLFRRHSSLQKYIVKTIQTLGEIQCGHACLSENSCVAQTYCQARDAAKGICFLHEKGIKQEEINILARKENCTYQQFISLEEDLCTKQCNRRGKCQFDYRNGRCSCDCESPYSGVFCETSPVVSLRFTTLGAKGNSGPISAAGYANTSLDGVVTLDKGIQKWTVPFTALYSLTVAGAAGGNAAANTRGGSGAVLRGVVQLVKGTQLRILIGQKGVLGASGVGAGGGGGTFVIDVNNALIAAAGGGGGGGGYLTSQNGENGQTSESGSVYGGVDGFGGIVNGSLQIDAGGGGGYRGDGSCCLFNSSTRMCSSHTCSHAGVSYLNGGLGGNGNKDGGFGGGGAAYGYFAGGGGGYSGGGVYATSSTSQAGGGGSYCTSGVRSTNDQNDGDGYVLISVP